MKKILIIISIITYCGFITAQNYADKEYYLIDSLDLSDLTKSDSLCIEKYISLYHNTKIDTLQFIYLDTLITNVYNENTWTSYNDFLYEFIQINSSGITNKKVLQLYKEHEANCLNNFGYYYMSKGDVKNSLDYYNKSLKLRLKCNDFTGQANSYLNIGFVYESQNEIDEAIQFYKKALAIYNQIDNEIGIARSNTHLGNLSIVNKDYILALYNYKKAIEIYLAENSEFDLSNGYTCLGNVYLSLENYKKSEEYILLAINLKIKLGDKIGLSKNYFLYGKLLMDIEHFKEAKTYVKKSFLLAQSLNNPNQILLSANTYGELLKKEGNYKEALELFELSLKTKDTIYSIENQKTVIQRKFQFEYNKQKAIDNANFENELALNLKEKEKQKTIAFFSMGIVLIILVFLFLLSRRLKDVKRKSLIIETQKIEVTSAHKILAIKNKEIIDSINYAKRIQTAILPSSKILNKYLSNYFVLYQPKDIVAGDFYWLEYKNNQLFFAVADCTGHGVPGAMVSVVCNNGLNRSVREHNIVSPEAILNKTREIVIQEFGKSVDEVKDGMDIALCTLTDNELCYAGANNPLWIIRKDSNMVEVYKADKQPIGVFSKANDFTKHKLVLKTGDTVYLFSDGYIDQFGGEKDKKFKSVNFKKLLLSISKLPMDEQKNELELFFNKWKGDLEQLDDVCILAYQHFEK